MLNEDIWRATILGVLQGLTEFLPISSSAHLILLPWLLGWEPFGILFDVILHGGTLLAVLIYFRHDWKELIGNMIRNYSNSGRRFSTGDRMADAVIIGTVPAVIVALCFRGWIEETARTPIVAVATLTLFGLLLWWADRRGRGDQNLSQIGLNQGLVVGVAQAIALIPGVSRSGITITAALLLGYTRGDSARFSFLLATPIIFLGAVNGILELLQSSEGGALAPAVVVIGALVSFVTGFYCIKYFLRFLETRTFTPFVLYRLGLAMVILFFLFH